MLPHGNEVIGTPERGPRRTQRQGLDDGCGQSRPRGRRWRAIATIFVLATFAIKLPLVLSEQWTRRIEVREYSTVAESIATGQGYSRPFIGTTYRASCPPAYCFLCAGLRMLFGVHGRPMIVLSLALLTGMACLSYWLAGQICAPAGLIAFLLVQLHPALNWYAMVKIHPLPLDGFMILATLCLGVRVWRRPSLAGFFWCGVVYGLTLLSRPSVALFLPVLFVYWGVRRGWEWRTAGRFALAVACGAMMVLPWTVRNYVVLGRLVPISTEAAMHLWRNFNPNTSGATVTQDGRHIFAVADPEFREKILGAGECEQMDIFFEEAVSFIRADPVRAIRLVGARLLIFVWRSPVTGIWYSGGMARAYYSYYVPIVLLCIGFGVFVYRGLRREQRETAIIGVLMFASVMAFQSVFFVESRHRWGVESILLCFAAASVWRLWWLARRALTGSRFSPPADTPP